MKRSKIFLGATTALLAIAGVAAAKHYSGTKAAYYVTQGNTWCAAVVVACTQTGTAFDCKYTTASQFHIQVPAFTQGPVGAYNPAAPKTCIGDLKYNGIE